MTGFAEDVDWFESLAFEILLFEALSYYKRPHTAQAYLLRDLWPSRG